jgi:hypothetical protein
MDVLVILFFIFMVTFLLRGTYALMVHRGLAPSGDAVIHLIIADGIRRNGHRIPERFPEFLLSGPHNYPSFFHWLLSFISKERLERYEPFIGTFIEMIHSAAIFFACYYWALKQNIANPGWIGFLSAMMFALTPLLVDHVGRVFSLSERPFGSLLGTVFLFFGLQYVLSSSFWALALSAAVMGIIFISSKFTVQAILFISFIFSLLAWTPKIGVPVIVGCVGALLFTKGYAIRVLKGHLRHSIFYKTFLLNHYLRPKSQYGDLIQSVVTGFRNPRVLIQAFRTNSLLKIFSMVPWLLVLIVSITGNVEEVRSIPVFRFGVLWVGSSVIVTCLTAVNGMRFLGEPERYLEFALLPLTFLCSVFLLERNSLASWLLGASMSLYGLLVFWHLLSKIRAMKIWDEGEEELCEWLRGLNPARIMTIPLKAVSVLVYRTRHQGLNTLTNISETSQQQRFKELCPILYPYPDSNLRKLVREYQLDLIVVHKPTLAFLENSPLTIHYDFSGLEKKYENRAYVAYRCERVKE